MHAQRQRQRHWTDNEHLPVNTVSINTAPCCGGWLARASTLASATITEWTTCDDTRTHTHTHPHTHTPARMYSASRSGGPGARSPWCCWPTAPRRPQTSPSSWWFGSRATPGSVSSAATRRATSGCEKYTCKDDALTDGWCHARCVGHAVHLVGNGSRRGR